MTEETRPSACPVETTQQSSFDPESAFRQNSRVGKCSGKPGAQVESWVNREQLSGLAAVSRSGKRPGKPLALLAGGGCLGYWKRARPPLAMFFKGETENEERTSRWKQRALPGQARRGAVSASASFPHVWAQERSPGLSQRLSGEPRSWGSSHNLTSLSLQVALTKAASKVAAHTVDVWADTARAGAQYENVENLGAFREGQGSSAGEPLSMDPSSPDDLLRCGPLPGPAGFPGSVGGPCGAGA